MEKEQALAFLNSPSLGAVAPGDSVPTNTPAVSTTPSLAPQTSNALSTVALPAGLEAVKQADVAAREKYLLENQEPGVPLDVESGAPTWDRLMLSFQRAKENQVAYLKKRYGDESVRTDKGGDLIVRVLDSETGKPKDVLVNEQGLSAKDFIDLVGTMPEVAAGILAMKKGQGLPMIGKLKGLLGGTRDVVATALGAETAGAAKDIAATTAMQGPSKIDLEEIGKERTKMAAADVAIGGIIGGAGRFFKAMKSPLAGSRTQVQFDALEAQKYFKDKYDVEVPLSIGESTGSPLASRTETFMEKLPGGGVPFKEFKAGQEEQLRKLQMIMMGKTPPTDEEVGSAIINKLLPTVEGAKTKVGTLEQELQDAATGRIEGIVSTQTMPQRQLSRSVTGSAIRDAVTAKRDAVKATADKLYDVVKAMPGGEGKVLEGAGLQDRFKNILSRLPSVEHTTEVPTGMLDKAGNPVLRTETGERVMKEFVPPNILARLNSIVDLKDPKFSLSDLQQMRREIYDDIAKGEGVPGLGTHYLADMGKAVTAAMDEAVSNLPTAQLKTALTAANEHYKKNVVPFNRIGLTELFRAADEPGFVPNSAVVTRIFSGENAVNNFELMKETLGAGSKEFNMLKRSIADNILESSREPGQLATQFINPKDLVTKLAKLRTDYPEIAQEVFGSKFNELFRQAKFAQYGQNAKITPDELKQLMADPSPTAAKFKQLVAAQAERDTLYRNDILKQVATGELPDKAINPVEFVNRFVSDVKTKPKDVIQAMTLIEKDPALLEDVRAKVVEKLFRDSARSATPSDIGKLLSDDPTRIVSGTSTFKQIGETHTRQKLTSVLGPEIYNDLVKYIALQSASEAKEQAFKSAGGLAAGAQIASLTRGGPLKYIYQSGKDWIAAKLLVSEPMRKWLSSVPANTEPGFAQLLLTSPPFLQAVAKDFGKGTGADAFISSIKNSVDRWMGEQPQAQPTKPTDEEERRNLFRQMLNAPSP